MTAPLLRVGCRACALGLATTTGQCYVYAHNRLNRLFSHITLFIGRSAFVGHKTQKDPRRAPRSELMPLIPQPTFPHRAHVPPRGPGGGAGRRPGRDLLPFLPVASVSAVTCTLKEFLRSRARRVAAGPGGLLSLARAVTVSLSVACRCRTVAVVARISSFECETRVSPGSPV